MKTKKNTQIPLKIQNMEIVEGNKKNNHGVMLAFTVEDLPTFGLPITLILGI